MQTTNPIGTFWMVDAGISAVADFIASPLVAVEVEPLLKAFSPLFVVDSTDEALEELSDESMEEALSDESNDSDMYAYV